MQALFPPLPARTSGRLAVSGGHEIAWEEAGSPDRPAVVFLHGGPGSGMSPKHRRYYDPERWRIVQLDQRGCGASTPRFALENNTTADLVADLEALRAHLGIARWTVFGPSWGSTLALAYAEAHPDRVEALVVEGVFLGSRAEIAWWWDEAGAGALFPDSLDILLRDAPAEVRRDPFSVAAWGLERMRAELAGGAPALAGLADPQTPLEALRESLIYRWSEHEERLSHLETTDEAIRAGFAAKGRDALIAHSLLEAHYFANACFLAPGRLIAAAERLSMPMAIIQSRYDLVCPVRAAWRLAAACPHADFTLAPAHGHAMSPPIHRVVRRVFDRLADSRD